MSDTLIEITMDPPGLDDDIQIERVPSGQYNDFAGPTTPEQIQNLPPLLKTANPPYSIPKGVTPLQHPIQNKLLHNIGAKAEQIIRKASEMPPELIEVAKQYIDAHVHQALPDVNAVIFGGSTNGLSSLGGDIDCTLMVPDNMLEAVEKQCASYLVDHAQFAHDHGIMLRDYAHCLEQYQISSYEVAELRKSGEAVGIDQQLLTKREKWQRSVVLLRVGSLFNAQEINDFVLRARVPILKLMLRYDRNARRIISYPEYMELFQANNKAAPEGIQFFSVDLCVNNLLPIQNTSLIREYIKASSLVKPMVLFLKDWLNKRDLSQKADQTNLNSYAVTLLVVFYLQQTGSLPCLQDTTALKMVGGYNCGFRVLPEAQGLAPKPNPPSPDLLGKNLLGFFEFYGSVFNYDTSVVSVRLGRAMNRIEKNWNQNRGDQSAMLEDCVYSTTTGFCPEPGAMDEHDAIQQIRRFIPAIQRIETPFPQLVNSNCALCIEDPFETNVNVARTLEPEQLKLLRREMRRGFSVLKRHSSDPIEWLLLSPQVDPPGVLPSESFKTLQERQKQIEGGANLKVEIVQPPKPAAGFKFSLTKEPPTSDKGSDK